MKFAFPCGNAPDVDLIHSHVEIAAKQHIVVEAAAFVKEPSQFLQPCEFEGEFIGAKLGAVRDVCVHNANAVYSRRDQAF